MERSEAEGLLKQLGEHYGEPVMPLSRFCGKMRAWFRAVQEGAERDDHLAKANGLARIAHAAHFLNIAIIKSNCLARLLYLDEDLRVHRCPVHHGHWSGWDWKSPECANEAFPRGCYSGADITGWMPEPRELERQWAYLRALPHATCDKCGKRYHHSPESPLSKNPCPWCEPELSSNQKCFCHDSHASTTTVG